MQCMEVPVAAWWVSDCIYNEFKGYLASFLRRLFDLIKIFADLGLQLMPRLAGDTDAD